VLQGLYFFEDEYSIETIANNFEFYEPITVHESSLSACIHAILAARIGQYEKAYEMYLQTARLDIDDYNNDTRDGCHITSMAGTWMAITKGFGGVRIQNDQLVLNPFLPTPWKSYSFQLVFRENLINVSVRPNEVQVSNKGRTNCTIMLSGELIQIPPGESLSKNRTK